MPFSEGILAQADNLEGKQSGSRQFLASSYVKFLESAGAQVVPIFNNLTTDDYTEMFNSLNGVLYPGGEVNLHDSGYFMAAQTFFNLAVAANGKGDFFPLWGTCLGFQALTVLMAGEHLLTTFDTENVSLALNLTDEALRSSRLFRNLPSELAQALTTKPITFNEHHYGITPDAFRSNSKLHKGFHILSTNTDRVGKPFVSTIEGQELPFYGIQWHTEKNMFDWTRQLAISHDPDAIAVTQYMADYFVGQARLSQHHFPSIEAEQKALIYNWHTSHSSSFHYEEIYVW